MLRFNKQNSLLKMFVLSLIVVLGASTFVSSDASAQGRGRGRGQSKKDEKFNNGHDARDGRRDGRGRDRDGRDRDDRDDRDDDNRDRRGGRDRDRDGVNDQTEIRQQAYRYGYDEGNRAGREDRQNNERYDFRDEGSYQDASAGYRDSYGSRTLYRNEFRAAFQQGYRDGFDNRNTRSRRSRLGSIIEDIFNR